MNSKLKRTTSRMRTEQMIANLRGGILAGERREGDFLPSELELCDKYQLSKNTVRKGLEILVTEGFVEKVPRIGTRVIHSQHMESITLRFGYYPTLIEEANMLMLIESFHKQYPHIQIQPIQRTYGYDRREERDRIQANGLDVMTINVFDFENLTGTDEDCVAFEPLEWQEGMYPFLMKPFMIAHELFARPLIFSPVILCYNKDHFREQNLPEPDSSWTWDDVRSIGSKLSQVDGRSGLYFHLPSENRWPLFLLQNGVVLRQNEAGKYQLNDPLLKEGLDVVRSLAYDRSICQSYMSENDKDVQTLFLMQKASMIMVTYNSLNALRDVAFQYDIAPVPYYKEPKTLLGVIALAISRDSKEKAAAQLFVDFLTSYDTQLYIRQHTLSIPGVKKAAEWIGQEPISNRPYRFHMYREIIPTFHYYSELNLTFSVLLTMREELKLYWSQMEGLDSVLLRLEEKL